MGGQVPPSAVLTGSDHRCYGNPHLTWRAGGVAALVFALALAFLVSSVFGKQKKVTSKTVSGVVLDQAENGIDGATVTLKDLYTGKTIAVYTRDGGHYQFSDLKFNHDYEIHADSKGVKSETRQVSSVDPRARIVLNLKIPPPSS